MLGDRIKLEYTSKSRFDSKLHKASQKVLKEGYAHFKTGECGRAIAKSNKIVDNFNKKQMKGKWGLKLVRKKYGSKSLVEDIKFDVGTPVMSYRKGVDYFNNEEFTVVDFDGEVLKLHSVDRDRDIEVKKQRFIYSFVLAFAITVYRSQGSTFNYDYQIFTEGMNRNELYVACTRATKWEQVHCALTEALPERELFSGCRRLNLRLHTREGLIYEATDGVKTYIGRTFDPLWLRIKYHCQSKDKCKFHVALQKDFHSFKWNVLKQGQFTINELKADETAFIQLYEPDELYNTLKVKKTESVKVEGAKVSTRVSLRYDNKRFKTLEELNHYKETGEDIRRPKGLTFRKGPKAWVYQVKGRPAKSFSVKVYHTEKLAYEACLAYYQAQKEV